MSARELAVEELIEEFLRQRRSGSSVDARTFAAGHPHLGPELLDALESAEMLESAHAERGAPALELPERFGEFRVVERLGGGGMGVVYRARQESLDRDVALKLIRPEHLYFPNARERFRREAEAAARLQHPGLVPIHTVGEADGVPFLAMELVDGATLGQALHELRARLPESLSGADLAAALQRATPAGSAWDPSAASMAFAGGYVDCVLRLVIQVAEALQHAHSREVLHRDVKPSNIAVTSNARALLFDFGLACLGDAEERLTATRTELGSLAYMAPEQLRGSRDAVDPRRDVYALGVTLYELLALRLPFAGRDTLGTRSAILAGAAPPLRTRNRNVPRDLEVVCAKAMERDVERRYADAAAFARDLANVLGKRPIEARPAGVVVQVRRWSQRHPVAAVALAVLFTVPSLLLWRESSHASALDEALEEARRQREAAQVEARDAQEINGFLTGLFLSVDPSEARGREVTARELLDEAARRLESGHLGDQPVVRARLLTAIGESYASLGEWESAERLLLRALALSETLEGGENLSTAQCLDALASLEHQLGRPTALERSARAAELHRKLAAGPSFEFSEVLMTYGLALADAERFAEAEAAFREALANLDGLPGEWISARAGVFTNLAHVAMMRKDYVVAISMAREAIRLQREFDAAPHPAISTSLNTVALSLRMLGRYDEARPVYAQLLDEELRLTGEESARFAGFLVSASNVELDTGRAGEAIAILERAAGIFERTAPPTFGNALVCLDKLASAYERAGRGDDALVTLRKRQLAVEEAFGPASWQALANRVRIAQRHDARGDEPAAREELAAALQRASEAQQAADDGWECTAAALLAGLEARRGACESARELVARARGLRDDQQLATAAEAWTRLAAGMAAECAGELDLARRELEPLAELARVPAGGEPASALARARLARLLASTEPERAAELALRARGELAELLGADHPRTVELAAWIEAQPAAAASTGER